MPAAKPKTESRSQRRSRAAKPAARGSTSAGYSMRGQQGRVIEALGRDIVGGRYQPETLLP